MTMLTKTINNQKRVYHVDRHDLTAGLTVHVSTERRRMMTLNCVTEGVTRVTDLRLNASMMTSCTVLNIDVHRPALL